MKERTTIQLEHETLKRLRKKKLYERETYDEEINRLIKHYVEKGESYEALEKKAREARKREGERLR